MPQLNSAQEKDRQLGIERLAWIQTFLVGPDAEGLRQATGDPDTTGLFPNQVAAILGWERLQAAEKSRQIGHSFTLAADSVARCVLEPNTKSIHISSDFWESQSKNDYCKRIIESLHPKMRSQITIKVENRREIVLETRRGYATIDFLAQRPPRGAERGALLLHEMAFMPAIEAILKASIFCTARGGYIKGCSSHQGADSLFNKIITNEAEESGEQPYRAWKVSSWPWWTCPAFSYDIEDALRRAPMMETDERVEKYGTPVLKSLRAGSSIDDFREEMECQVLDERYSYYPIELIQRCQSKDPSYWFEKVECSGGDYDTIQPGINIIDDLASEIRGGRLTGEWLWGFDVGRYNNPDALTVAHRPDKNVLALRLAISMSNMPFHKKQELITHFMKQIPVTMGHIDATGIGMQLSEWASQLWGQRAIQFTFNNEKKALLANNLKIRMERNGLIIPVWTKLARQIHQIKKTVTPIGNPVYDSDRNEHEHADLFWSLALLNGLIDLPEANYAFTPLTTRRDTNSQAGMGAGTRSRIWTPGRPVILGR